MQIVAGRLLRTVVTLFAAPWRCNAVMTCLERQMPNRVPGLRFLIPLTTALCAEYVSSRCGLELSGAITIAIIFAIASSLGYVCFGYMQRRRFQFSLLVLLVVVTLFAVLCSCGVMIRQIMRQHEAVMALEKLGNEEVGPVVRGPEQSLGIDGTSIYLNFTKVTDDELDYCKEFSQLHGLFLSSTRVTDVGLVKLKGLNDLRALER